MTPLQVAEGDAKTTLFRYSLDTPLPDGIELYHDKEKVCLYMRFSGGGSHPAGRRSMVNTLQETLRALGVQRLDVGAMTVAIEGNDDGKPVLIASGQRPTHGENGRLQLRFHAERRTKNSLSEDEYGRVDFRDVASIPQVKAGDVVAEIIEPTAGEAGEDVFGNPIPAVPGEPVAVKSRLGRNVAVDETGTKVVAKVNGLVTVDKGKITVSPIYKIGGDVDFGTGNIKFDGDVVINGSVREDFIVEATGSVHVAKNIERATVVAGTDINVAGGIIGKEGVEVVAGRNVTASYTNNAFLKASDTITITNEMMHSVARAKRISVHTGRGAVLGGEIHATEYINVKSAGDPDSCVTTVLEIEYDPEIVRQIKAKQERLTVLAEKHSEAKMVYEKLSDLGGKQARGLSKSAVEKMEKLRELMHKVREQQTKLNFEIAALEEQLQRSDNVKIVVQDKLYPDSRLFILGSATDVVEPTQGGTFKLVGKTVKRVHSR